jgi:protein-S-isoprenylcysteine O-methyltransferase Ste14
MMDKRTLQRIRVPLGFLAAAVFIVFARPGALTMTFGAILIVVGLGIRAWAAGHIRKAEQLASTGPYAYTRNPLYLGSFVMAVGFTVAAGVWWLGLVFLVLFIGIYRPVMRVEADDMRRIFGSEFEKYERDVPLFIPRLPKTKGTDTRFDPELYLRYREYRAAMGSALAMGVLAAKAYFFS